MSRPLRDPERRLQALALLSLVAGTAYLGWRILDTVDLAVWWVSVPLVLLEAHSLLSFGVFVLVGWDVGAVPPAPPVRDAPGRVAVLVPTYNESLEVLLPVVAAAVALELDHETWVLDDGDRPWVRRLAERLGAAYRVRPDRAGAKAGNLNAALAEIDADYVLVLDADHVPHREVLVRTLGYFEDPSVALVQTPQDFYNTDSFEHVRGWRGRGRTYSEQALFYRVLQPARNRWNAVFWCGTGAVLRTSALASVGGIATGSITEDIQTTMRLHRAGWRSVYHDEVLARGLAADDGSQYLAQRLRWGTGAMQVLRQERVLRGPGLTLAQRLSYLATLLGWFDAWRTLLYLLLPAAVLLTGASPIRASAPVFAAAFVPTLLLQQAALYALSRGHGAVLRPLVFEFVRMPANIAATCTLLTRHRPRFRVTDKGRVGEVRERIGVPRLHAAVLAVSTVALAWAGATAAGWTPTAYAVPAAAYASGAWLTLNAGLLVLAVRRIRSERHATERRAAVRFPVETTVEVSGERARLVDLSVTGLRVAVPPGVLLPEASEVVLDTPYGSVCVPAVVRSVAGRGDELHYAMELAGGHEREKAVIARWVFGEVLGDAVPVTSLDDDVHALGCDVGREPARVEVAAQHG